MFCEGSRRRLMVISGNTKKTMRKRVRIWKQKKRIKTNM